MGHRVVESVVGTHLLNYARDGGYKVHYRRERNDEVDFVLQKGEQIIALEVKSGNSNKAKGMQVFQKTFHPHKALMVGLTGLRREDFLKINPGELF